MRPLDLALRLSELGISSIPITTDRKPKVPWTKWKTSVPNKEIIAYWFQNELRIGIIAGRVLCLDVDLKHSPDPQKHWDNFLKHAQLLGLEPLLQRVMIETTPSGGRHLFWLVPNSTQYRNLVLAKTNKGQPLFETRGFGGYFIAWPTPGYQLIQGNWNAPPELTAEESDAILELAASFNEYERPEIVFQPTVHGSSLVRSVESPGDHYDKTANIAELLQRHGWTQVGTHYWRRPGKTQGVSATWNVIPNRFYVFSTNATPFEALKVYRPWHVFALLECGGDFSQAARKIASTLHNSIHPNNSTGRQLTITSDNPSGDYLQSLLTSTENHFLLASILKHELENKVRWTPHRGWMIWTKTHWKPCSSSIILTLSSQTLQDRFRQALLAKDDEKIRRLFSKSCSIDTVRAALSFLEGLSPITTSDKDWDADPWLLNCKNGILNLKTGELIAHHPRFLISHITQAHFDPEARHESWEQHLNFFLPSPNLRRQLQRTVGTALVGAVLEERLNIWYGTGANGKTTTSRVLLETFGSYAGRAATNLLTDKNAPVNAIADLAGLRLVFNPETEHGQHLSEALIKELTGGDIKKARYLYREYFQFPQTFSLIMITNAKPNIRGQDHGIWRRIRLLPWTVTLDEKSQMPQDEVVSKLTEHSDAILAWAYAGLNDFIHDYHWTADEVKEATQEYHDEMDTISNFISSECESSPHSQISFSDFYKAYLDWTDREREYQLSKKSFAQALNALKIQTKRTGKGKFILGLKLRLGEPEDLPVQKLPEIDY